MDIREILSNYGDEDYIILCKIADALGMEALTEEEQIVVLNYTKFN